MKIVAQYHDHSKKNTAGAYGKLISKSFRGQTPARVIAAKVKWEKAHRWMHSVNDKLVIGED